MTEIHTPEEYHQFLNENSLCGVYFYTTTCGICDVLKPKVKEIFDEHELPVARINLMHLPSLAGPLLIMGVPTLIVMLEGKEQERLGAYMQMHELSEKLSKLSRHLA